MRVAAMLLLGPDVTVTSWRSTPRTPALVNAVAVEMTVDGRYKYQQRPMLPSNRPSMV